MNKVQQYKLQYYELSDLLEGLELIKDSNNYHKNE